MKVISMVVVVAWTVTSVDSHIGSPHHDTHQIQSNVTFDGNPVGDGCRSDSDCDTSNCEYCMSDGQCRAFDPECCDSHSCGVGDGDCDPGTCPQGLTCGKNNFLEYHPLLSECEKGWTKHAEVCIAQVNGGWSSWTDDTPCSSTCNGGTKRQKRLCDAPTPRFGGAICIGESTRNDVSCNENITCTLTEAPATTAAPTEPPPTTAAPTTVAPTTAAPVPETTQSGSSSGGNKPVFRKVEDKNCEFNENDNKIENLVDAMNSCHLDGHCMAVYDKNCKGQEFYLCKHGSITPSKLGNCVYVNDGPGNGATKEDTSPEATTAKEATSPEPMTTQEATSPEPATTKEATSPGPTTTKVATSPEPMTTQEATSPEPATTKEATSPEPTTTKVATSPEPTTTKEAASPEPTTTKEATFPKEMTTVKETTITEEPTTANETTTTGEPTTTEQPMTTGGISLAELAQLLGLLTLGLFVLITINVFLIYKFIWNLGK